MLDVLKISAVFVAILVLIRLRWNIGYVLITASGLLALLYLMPLDVVLSTIMRTVTDAVTIKLFFVLTLIRVLEIILREKQVLARMTTAARTLLKKKRFVIISMPALIGLLPSLGGAYFSAPMVDESTKGLKMSQEEKGFINYWFRHPWECILPLYPGILLAAAVSHIELRSFILANVTYAVLIFATGFMFSMRNISGEFKADKEDFLQNENDAGDSGSSELKRRHPYWNFFPLIFILFLVIVLDVELHYALALTILPLLVFYRYKGADILRFLKYGFAIEVIVLIVGTMLFKMTMENSGAVGQLSRYFSESGMPLLPILLVLPFITGLLTGITVAFVSSTFPLLISISGGAFLNEMTLAFAAGFIGVLLSPVHLCLVLTREYFKADMRGIYKRIIPGCLIVLASALILYHVL
jgi:integral membrane protein (TIGR00529 family)